LTDQELIAALKQGTVHIDCARIELVQNKISNRMRYVGPGYIYQQDDGILAFRMYVQDSQNASDLFEDADHSLPGTLFDEDEYYSLTCLSHEGDTWVTPRLLVRISWSTKGVRIRGRVDTILRSRSNNSSTLTPHYLRIHFFDNIDLPFTGYIDTGTAAVPTRSLQGAKFTSNRKEFDIRSDDGEIIMEVSARSPFPPNFYMRLIEALTFLSASAVYMESYLQR
jgi:hypothetical protein